MTQPSDVSPQRALDDAKPERQPMRGLFGTKYGNKLYVVWATSWVDAKSSLLGFLGEDDIAFYNTRLTKVLTMQDGTVCETVYLNEAPPEHLRFQGDPDDLNSLSFSRLRAANLVRLPQFKNGKGERSHSQPDGSDWSDSDWIMAVTGELGELANLRKKVLRGDLPMDEARPMLADELADVVTYLDILAMRLGVDLGEAVRHKFNRVSDRVGCDVKL